MEKITILIADDHTLVRETWSFILNTDPRFKVIAESGSGEDAVELAKQLRPQVVIMDINLPGMNGIEATQQIRKFSPASKILGVSLHSAYLCPQNDPERCYGLCNQKLLPRRNVQGHHGDPEWKKIHLRGDQKHFIRTGY